MMPTTLFSPVSFLKVALVLAALLLAQDAFAGELQGRVVGIADGDTLTLLTPQRHQVRVRLADIAPPERHQPFGTRTRQLLSTLAFGRSVRVAVRDTDRYGR